MKIVSLLLARGGSKGIPKKNIVSVGGHPLLKYTIDAALSSRSHETWVSTDSSEIKKIALALGSSPKSKRILINSSSELKLIKSDAVGKDPPLSKRMSNGSFR